MIPATVIRMDLNQRGKVAVTIAGDDNPEETTILIEMAPDEAQGWYVGEKVQLGPLKTGKRP